MHQRLKKILFWLASALMLLVFPGCSPEKGLSVVYFQADVTPPIGSPVAYAPTRSITDSLSARGVVLYPAGQQPVVLCSVDWLLVSNESMDQFKSYLAEAAGTVPDRVSVHTVHQHDTPWCDISSAKILDSVGLGGIRFDLAFLDKSMKNTAEALRRSAQNPVKIKSVGIGEAKVEKVASNRRILGDDGKVKIVRFSSARDSAAINAPEGVIDPYLKTVTFWDENDKGVAALNYYATHPQSYYGEGDVNPEFIGMARNSHHRKTGIPQVFFIGAAGNIAAGKYNNGSHEMRPVLAQRIETAMTQALEKMEKQAVPDHIVWRSEPLHLPVAPHLAMDSIRLVLSDTSKNFNERFTAARHLAWVKQNKKADPAFVTSLQLGPVWLLHLPGEPFVEYQLAAQQSKPGDKVCTAAYGNGGMIYIGTSIAYSQGGYEVDKRVNMTTAAAEPELTRAISNVLP